MTVGLTCPGLRGLRSGGGGTSVVTTARVIALNASSRPLAGKPNALSISSAVAPLAPTRTMANAYAMLAGDTTQLPEAALPNPVPSRPIPAATAGTGAADAGITRATFSARSTVGRSGSFAGAFPPHAASNAVAIAAATRPAHRILMRDETSRPALRFRGRQDAEMVGRRSAVGGFQVDGSAATWSPERMSFTSEPDPSEDGNQTNGMPRRSAYRICLPNLAAFGETSVGIPRPRRAAAIRSDTGRSASAETATSTQVGTGRDTESADAPNSRPSIRETPSEMPTPGYRSVPELARLS